MNAFERKAAFSTASIFAFRMLGLFMILPVFSLYAEHLKNATPELIGLALGIYGLTQALLQIPFGMCSDKFGRKPIIIIGLILFAIGSVVAALSTSIEGVIIGRALQGAGAIGSTLTALLADLTSEGNRTKAMAVLGLTIGFAFTAAMVIGPILNQFIHVSGIFWFTAVLAIIGIVLLFAWVPTPKKTVFHRDAEPVPALFKDVLKDKELLRLNFGIFSLHAILTAIFVVLPIMLEGIARLPESKQWMLYLPVLLLAFVFMVPMIIIAEKRRCMKPMFLVAIMVVALSQIGLWYLDVSTWLIALCLFVFFTMFTFLEASLPSLVSKQAPAGSKGTAMGVYSSLQFLGIFVGGSVAGWLYGQHHLTSVFLACGGLAIIWFALAVSMHKPRYLATQMLNVGKVDAETASKLTKNLLALPGVAEAVIIVEEGIAYLKVDSKVIDKEKLMQYAAS